MNVLVVDDEPVVRRAVGRAIGRCWWDARFTWASSLSEAERAMGETPHDVVTIDLGLTPNRDRLLGIRLLERMAKEGRADRAVVMTGRTEAVDAARRAGATVVLTKPFGDTELREAGRRLGIRLVGEAEAIDPAFAPIVGSSRAMQVLRETARQVAKESGPVLVQGETGTGKELVARAIHGCRGRGAFHALNCSTLDALAESQLFGHARGAFTSAERAVRGAFEQAGEGVLFLDEIGDIPMTLQPKLLRVLEGHAFQALAGEKWIESRARIVAATHVDLETLVAEGRFREDLYYRLAVHVIRMPPLRERAEDIPDLVEALLGRLKSRPRGITADAIAALATRPWPGNVRQLASFLERLAVQTGGDTIEVDDVLAVEQAALGARASMIAPGPVKVAAPLGVGPGQFDVEMNAYARGLFERALRETNGNVSAAARLLGLDRMAMVRRMEKQGRR